MSMSISIIAFAIMAAITILIAAATVIQQLEVRLPAMALSGDSSLSRHSVNWLGGISFGAALLICLM